MVTAMTMSLKDHLKKRESIMGFFFKKGEEQSTKMLTEVSKEKKSQNIKDRISILEKKIKVNYFR